MEGQLYESNGATLNAASRQAGFTIQVQTHVADDYEATEVAIREQLNQTDVLLISGGISVGDYDHVGKALKANGVEEIFYRVRQKPGKPLFFGKKGNTFFFGLPGNPASSLVCFYVYVLPLLLKMAGSTNLHPHQMSLPLAAAYNFPFDRPTFLKAQIAENGVAILDGQGSSMLLSMAKGNALVLLEDPQTYPKGSLVKCIAIN